MNVHSRAGKKFQKVVKLSENAKRCSSPDQAARFVRRLPDHRDRLHPRFTLLLIRARYFEPTTGEFTSQDPLGYVDGMSLYRAYFIAGAVDPFGTQNSTAGNWKEIRVQSVDELYRVQTAPFPETGKYPGETYSFNIKNSEAAAKTACSLHCAASANPELRDQGVTDQISTAVKSGVPYYSVGLDQVNRTIGYDYYRINIKQYQHYIISIYDLTQFRCLCCPEAGAWHPSNWVTTIYYHVPNKVSSSDTPFVISHLRNYTWGDYTDQGLTWGDLKGFLQEAYPNIDFVPQGPWWEDAANPSEDGEAPIVIDPSFPVPEAK